MFERFSEGARRTVQLAQHEAGRLGHPYLGTEHLLLGILEQSQDPAAAVLIAGGLDARSARRSVVRLLGGPAVEVDGEALASIGVDLEAVKEAVEATFGEGVLDAPAEATARRRRGSPRFTDRAKKVMSLAVRAAAGRRDGRIEVGHLLLGVLREGGGLAIRVLREHGFDLAEVERATEAGLG